MKWQHWTAMGVYLIVMLVYLYVKQYDMVFAWLKPEANTISKGAEWAFLQYSSGRIVYARECLEVAKGWDALDAFWPLSLSLVIASFIPGIVAGYFLRYSDDAAEYERKLSELEKKYNHDIEVADNKYWQADNLEAVSRQRMREANEKEAAVRRREKAAEEKDRNIEKTVEEQVQATRKQLQHLQEDYKNRGHKMETLEKEKVELKRKNIALEKEILKISEVNLALTKENLELKREK